MADDNKQDPEKNQPKPPVSQETIEETANTAEGNNQQNPAAQGTAAQNTAAQDTVAQDTAAQDTAAQDRAAQNTAAQDRAAQDTVAQDTAAQDTAAQETAAQNTAAQDRAAQNTAAQDTTQPLPTQDTIQEIAAPKPMRITPDPSNELVTTKTTDEQDEQLPAKMPAHEVIVVDGAQSTGLAAPVTSENKLHEGETAKEVTQPKSVSLLSPEISELKEVDVEAGKRKTSTRKKRAVSIRDDVDMLIEEDLQLSEEQKEILKKFDIVKRPEQQDDMPELQIEDVIQVKRAWLKPIGLSIIWLLFTIQFVIYRDSPLTPTLVSIYPNEKHIINIPFDTQKAVSLSIKGPFIIDGHLVYAGREDEANFLFLQAVRTFYDENKTEIITVKISDLWREYLDTSQKIEMIKPSERYVLITLWQNISKDEDTSMYLHAFTDINQVVTVKYKFAWLPVPTQKGLLFAVLVLVLLYALFIFEVTNPTLSSLICSTFALAILSILTPKPSFDTILQWIDMPMLTLLFSMMIIVAIISDAGMFDFIAVYAYQISKGSIYKLIMSLCFFISLVSAFLNNSTTMLLSSPITIKLCEVSNMNPVSVLIYLMICANVGAAFTPLGSPPNIIITTNKFLQEHGITFGVFVLNMAPCTFLVLLQSYYQLRFYSTHSKLLDYHESVNIQKELVNRGIQRWERASTTIGSFLEDDRRLRNVISRTIEKMRGAAKGEYKTPKHDEKPHHYERTLAELKKRHGIVDKILLIKCATVLVFIVTIFMLRSFEFFNVIGFSWTALLGAILLLILADIYDYESLFCRIEWSTLMFLSSFFVLIEVLSHLGFEDIIGQNITQAIESTPSSFQLLVALLLILWVTAFASCFLNNNPVTQMMVRIVVSIAQIKHLGLPLGPLVWALVMGAAFGGNGSLIGASANIVTAGVASMHLYKLTFRSYFLVGFTIMLVNLLVASVYLIFMYVLIGWDGMIF